MIRSLEISGQQIVPQAKRMWNEVSSCFFPYRSVMSSDIKNYKEYNYELIMYMMIYILY